MPKIVILGAGIGGISMAYELRSTVGRAAEITLLSDTPFFHFVPSNPWVAVGWRRPEAIKISLPEVLQKFGIAFDATGVKRLIPRHNRVELNDGRLIDYDYLVIATGPALAFDEVEGLGPAANTVSICHVDHAAAAADRWRPFCEDPGPIVVGAVQGASCFGPAYEFAFLANADLRRRKIRDRVPITSSHRSRISAASDWAASAIPRGCSNRRCATATSAGSPTPKSSMLPAMASMS